MATKFGIDSLTHSFRWDIRNFSAERRIVSSEYEIQGFKWSLELRKKLAIHEPDHVQVFLHRLDDDDDRDEFPCYASAEIKLLSFDKKIPSHRLLLLSQKFGGADTKVKHNKLLTLNEMNNADQKYIENDQIVLDVQIMVDPPIKVYTTPYTKLEVLSIKVSAQLLLNFSNINKAMTVESSDFAYCNNLWHICALKNDDALGIYVKPTRNESNRKYDVTVQFELQSNGAHDNLMVSANDQIDENNPFLGCLRIIDWQKMIDEFTHDDTLTVEIRLCAKEKREAQQTNNVICPICMENLQGQPTQSAKCGHLYCQECMEKGIRPRKKCALCNKKVLASQIRNHFFS